MVTWHKEEGARTCTAHAEEVDKRNISRGGGGVGVQISTANLLEKLGVKKLRFDFFIL